MARTLHYVLILFVLSEIKATISNQNGHRFIRALYPNITNYNNNRNWANRPPQYGTPNRTYTHSTYPGDRYAQGYLDNPSYPSQIGGGSQYGYNTPPNGYHHNQPLGRNNSTPSKNPDPFYNQGNQADIGWRPQLNRYNNTSPQRPNTNASYYQGNQNNLNYPRPDYRPQYSAPPNTGSSGYGTKPHWNNSQSQGSQYYTGPNDLMIHRYKRSHHRHHRNHNCTFNETTTDYDNANNSSDNRHHYRHHHRIYHLPPPPQFGPPPPPPPPPSQFAPRPRFGSGRHHTRHNGPPRFNPPPGFNGTHTNGTVAGSNGTYPSVSEPGHSSNGTANFPEDDFNGRDEGGFELPDLNGFNATIPSSE